MQVKIISYKVLIGTAMVRVQLEIGLQPGAVTTAVDLFESEILAFAAARNAETWSESDIASAVSALFGALSQSVTYEGAAT